MLTQVWAPAASTGITTTAVKARETDRFVMLSFPSFTKATDKTVLFPPAPTVKFADSIFRMPQASQVVVVLVVLTVTVVVVDSVVVIETVPVLVEVEAVE
jgi:hypothetical protein